MACLHLEGAVICPEVDGIRDARYAAFVDLEASSAHTLVSARGTHHFSRLGPADGKLQIGIFLPVSEEEGEFGEEAVVHIADQFNCRRAGVAGNTTF